jgi:hypothetical protein
MKTLEKTDDESNCEILRTAAREPRVFEKHEELSAPSMTQNMV